MEKRKRIEAVNGEILLPEIIQHIQSCLSGKEAAQTSILSKSWYSAWLTRPNLYFDERDVRYQIREGFWEFARKTVQRYEELNLKILSLRLCVSYQSLLTIELIVKAMKMGATDLNFQLRSGTTTFVLPHAVLGSETLIRLSVIGSKIDRVPDGKVNCSRLKSLSLSSVYIEGDIIWDIISSCPLIEELLLSECTCLFVTTRRMLALSPINLHVFHKLKCLLLEKVKIDTLFFSDFSSRFPCLKDLTLHHCFGYKEIQISSRSLECISCEQKTMLRANFDVPSIRKFSFSSSSVPSMSFKTASRKWESDISITCSGKRARLSSSWFLKFKKFLIELSPSKISLTLNISTIFENSSDYARDIRGLPNPTVENLMLLMDAPSSVCSAFLDGLFWSCHPMFITQYWLPKSGIGGKTNSDFLELLCKTLIQEVSENYCIPNRNMSGLHDLEEVNLEFFEENLAEWQPLSWKTLLDASANLENKQKILFQLRWRREPITFK